MADEQNDTNGGGTPLPEHPGGGPLPGRTRRRGALPGSGNDIEDRKGNPGGGGGGQLPVGTPLDQQAEPAHDADLAYTEKPQLPNAKVWGLRISEQHYNTGNTMVDVLATQFRLDKRQVGELIVQFLVTRRFDLFNYVKEKVGPAPVDLDFFAQKEGSDYLPGQ